MRLVRLEPLAPVGEGLRKSVDLLDLVERLQLSANALKACADTLTEAHATNTDPVLTAFADAKRAAGDVFVAITEYAGNAALQAARDGTAASLPASLAGMG